MLLEFILHSIIHLFAEVLGEKVCSWLGAGIFALVVICLVGGYIWYKMSGGQV